MIHNNIHKLINCSHLHFFKHVYWITQSPVVEGKVKVDTGPGVIRLSHPVRKKVKVMYTSREDPSKVFPLALDI